MKRKNHFYYMKCVLCIVSLLMAGSAFGADLPEIKEKGVLRHIGVPYANFITGSGDGMSVELTQLFARHLGVEYEYVETNWKNVVGDLTGKEVKAKGEDIEIIGDVPVRGDVVANGFTILPWRQKIIDFSEPIFPTQVWLIANADLAIKPIVPSGEIDKDIAATKKKLNGLSVLGVSKTCLDPALYDLKATGADVILFTRNLNELAPAVINREADTAILDVPDALVALEKWPGQISVIGPISPSQEMGVGFAKTSPQLRDAFNLFLQQCKKDGTYLKLIRKYYSDVFDYYPEFFEFEND